MDLLIYQVIITHQNATRSTNKRGYRFIKDLHITVHMYFYVYFSDKLASYNCIIGTNHVNLVW